VLTIGGLVLSVMLVTVNLIMLVIFLRLFGFFLKYRTTIIHSRFKKNQDIKNLTLFNKFIIWWVLFLCVFSLWSMGSLLTDGIAKLIYGI
jgi:hypothetical protein